MITFGYAKAYQYSNDGTLMIKVRIPSVHGAYTKSEYRGKTIHNYVEDSELGVRVRLRLKEEPGQHLGGEGCGLGDRWEGGSLHRRM